MVDSDWSTMRQHKVSWKKNVLKKWPRETHQVLLQGLTAGSKYSKSTRIYAARRQRSRSPKVKHLSEVTLWQCVFAALPCSCLKCSNAKNSDRDMWRSSWSTLWSYDAVFQGWNPVGTIWVRRTVDSLSWMPFTWRLLTSKTHKWIHIVAWYQWIPYSQQNHHPNLQP